MERYPFQYNKVKNNKTKKFTQQIVNGNCLWEQKWQLEEIGDFSLHYVIFISCRIIDLLTLIFIFVSMVFFFEKNMSDHNH